jgi:putative alpha-1,2-mannosidase
MFAAMGFYPLCPSRPEYALASPSFRKVVISQPGGSDFVVEAPEASAGNVYIDSAWKDGQPFSASFILHSDITEGHHFLFRMVNE